jgi:hypothetical protein
MSPEIQVGIALFPLAILALGALVKWWMSSTERAITAVVQEMKRLVDTVGVHATEIAVLKAKREADAEEMGKLRERQHDLSGALQRLEGKLFRKAGEE